MKAILIATISLVFTSFASAEAGFSNGNDIGITFYNGWVHVRCMGGGPDSTHFCQGADYDPGSHDRFAFDRRVNADKVELTAVHEDGSSKSKKVKFNSDKGLSNRVNLVIRTLLQRPLLEEGVNRVSYELTNDGKSVANGEFESRVEVVGDLRCPDLWISEWGNTCNNASSACNTYFNQVRNCQ